MGLYTADNTRITRAAFPATNTSDPEMTVTADVYSTKPFDLGSRPFDSRDSVPQGSIRTLLFKAGAIVRKSQIDKLFPAATVKTVTPATGPAAGGTVVTITGTNLDGIADVKFGSTTGTALKILTSEKIQVTSPAGAAGAVSIVLNDDAGAVTKTTAFTYA
ncbi:IPT/TIG domain-containing protein [Streptomyces sp. NPDC094447]|uniref:IPT/TIG domain-containing protein n=1 Tax=Streptomyces sp. NPDC094447 TaxID=3366062 RepID=UPI003829C4AA